ncbi:2-phosphosulfolactate phosphatase, partial [Nocardioides pacificus]
MLSPYDQRPFRVRVEWGPVGVREVARHTTYAVVVDVLSFTTTLSVAMDHGTRVLPFRWKDERAAAHAAEHGAVLARGRFETRDLPGVAGVSLSPAALRATPGIEALVLPSPNGSAISVELAASGVEVVAAALRNRRAVAQWLAERLSTDPDATVSILAGGERWGGGG